MERVKSSRRPPWAEKIETRRREAASRGEDRPCECWDHLREAGITPDRTMADRFPDVTKKRYRSDNGDLDRRKKSDEDEEGPGDRKPKTAEERAHLRSAIANREVI